MEATKLTCEVTTDCRCEDELGNNVYCYGDCWTWMLDDLHYNLFTPWCEANNLDHHAPVQVIGTRMGWDSRNGWAEVKASAQNLVEALSLRGEYRLEFTLEGNRLTARRYSHDEPTGSAEFFFVPVTE